MDRSRLTAGLAAACAVACLLVVPATALGRAYTPPKKRTYHGLQETGRMEDWQRFRKSIKAHPAVMQTFHTWGTRPTMAMERWTAGRARGMISISTAPGGGKEVIDVYGIAHGKGDGYPLWLNHDIADWNHPVYLRLMAEMNGHWNPYSAFNEDGSSRGNHHSTTWFRRAWRRFAIIVRGGDVSLINARLRRIGLPPMEERGPYKEGLPARLPRPKVSLQWVPQTEGNPDFSSNGPDDYWPGRKYVDWVGLDMYSIYPNFDGFNRFYRKYRGKPFVIGEYGLWGEDNPAYVKQLFGWARRHERARMLVYYQATESDGPFKIWRHRQSRNVMRKILNRKRYPEFAPEARKYPATSGPSGGVPGT